MRIVAAKRDASTAGTSNKWWKHECGLAQFDEKCWLTWAALPRSSKPFDNETGGIRVLEQTLMPIGGHVTISGNASLVNY